MDEPFQGVDAATETAIVELLRELRDAGRTVFVVHHDLPTVPRVFRLGDAAERPQDRQRADRTGIHAGEHRGDLWLARRDEPAHA